MLGRILKIGLPVAVQDGCIQVAFIIITIIANHRGLIDSAAVGIVEKIISAMFIVPSSMLATVSALSLIHIYAVGTSKALEIGEVEGAMSGLSVAVAGIMTAVLCPLFSELIH